MHSTLLFYSHSFLLISQCMYFMANSAWRNSYEKCYTNDQYYRRFNKLMLPNHIYALE